MQNQFDQRQQSIQKRLMQAQVMRDQEFNPAQGQISGGVYIRPDFSQSLAQGLRMYGGMKESQKAEQDLQALQTERTGANQSAMANALRMMDGAPADVLPEDQAGPVRGAQAPDMRGAYAELMKSPDYAQMGQQGMMQLPAMEAQAKAREDDRAFRAQESEMNRAARAEELQVRMQDQRASQQERIAAQKELREMQIQAQKDTQRMIAANRPERQAQIIQTEQGPMQLVGGRAMPIIGPDGKPVMGKPTGAAGSTTAVAKTQDARDALATIDMAEKLIGKATGSGIGSAVDATAAFFGKSTQGAQAAAQLKALEGDLVAKMPKMSGPQSDKDVLLYRQMAGQIGDPSIPPETKRAALQSIREMQNRYAAGGAGAQGSWEAPAAPKARMKFDAQGNPIQ